MGGRAVSWPPTIGRGPTPGNRAAAPYTAAVTGAERQILTDPSERGAGPQQAPRPGLPAWSLLVLIVGIGWLAQWTQPEGARAPLLWPPVGVALAGLLLGGLRSLPAVALGLVLLEIMLGNGAGAGLALATSGTIQALSVWFVLTRVVRFDVALSHPSDLGWLLLVGVLAGPLIDAAVAVLVIDAPAPTETIVLFVQRWAGGAAGVLAVTPSLLSWRSRVHAPRDEHRAWVDFAVATAVLTVLLLEVPALFPDVPLESLAFPVLIYLGLRHGLRIASTGVALLCVLLVGVLSVDAGPFHLSETGLLALSAFSLTAGGTGLLAAILGVELRRQRNREASDRAVRDVLDNSPGMTWVTDPDGQCIFASRSWREFTGLSPTEHLTQGWAGQVLPEDERALADVWGAARDAGAEFAQEYRGIRADGETRWLDSRARVREGADGRPAGHVGTCIDVTERKLYEAFARRTERLASVGTLASGIAHEINNPVASILLAAQVARTRTEDEKLTQLLGRIEDDAERAGRVTRRVLQFARSDPLERKPLDMVPVITAALELAETEAAHAGTTLTADLPESLPLVSASAGDMKQVLVNLILNAIQAEAREVRCHASSHAERVVVWMEDDGRGPTVDVLEHAFDPFFTTRGGTGGSGLGLSVSHGIVEAHEGTISLEARLGGGARVVIELPTTSDTADV